MHYCGKIKISEITSKEISEKSYHPTPVPEIWRLDLVEELLEIRDNAILMTGKQMKSQTAFSSYAPPSLELFVL